MNRKTSFCLAKSVIFLQTYSALLTNTQSRLAPVCQLLSDGREMCYNSSITDASSGMVEKGALIFPIIFVTRHSVWALLVFDKY